MILQFLVEAVTLTGLGGLIGIVLSVLITFLLSLALPALRSEVPMWAVTTGVVASVASVAIGVFLGVAPAVQASRLDPVTALRYE